MSNRNCMVAALSCLLTMNVFAPYVVAKPVSATVHPYNYHAEVNPEILQQDVKDRRHGMVGKRYMKNIAVKGNGGWVVKLKQPLQLKEIRFCLDGWTKLSTMYLEVYGTDRTTNQKVKKTIAIEPPALVERSPSDRSYRIDVATGTKTEPGQLEISEVRLIEKNDPARKGKATEYLRIDFTKVGDAEWLEPDTLSFDVIKEN